MAPPPARARASSAPALPSRPCTVHGELWQALCDPWQAPPLCRNHQRSIVTPPVLANWHDKSSELLSAKQHCCPSPAPPSPTARRPLTPLVRRHPCRCHTSAATL
ncbi:hypothetical protein C8J57DRAFT_1513877 [Mycena rebaudengoi]|nr:hypothetical protein C8J57DRAFT_1513877 [Mycena rebaudengoi]